MHGPGEGYSCVTKRVFHFLFFVIQPLHLFFVKISLHYMHCTVLRTGLILKLLFTHKTDVHYIFACNARSVRRALEGMRKRKIGVFFRILSGHFEFSDLF